MRKVLDLYLKLEENDIRYRDDEFSRRNRMYEILKDAIIQLNVSQLTDTRALPMDLSKMKKYQDESMSARIGVEILKAGYAETEEHSVHDGIERRLSVLVLK